MSSYQQIFDQKSNFISKPSLTEMHIFVTDKESLYRIIIIQTLENRSICSANNFYGCILFADSLQNYRFKVQKLQKKGIGY